MNESAVSVKNLTKSFSGRRVVDNLSFDVQKGEVFALLGHNGAGKSTTLSGLACSFRVHSIKPALPWKRRASNMPLCIPPRQTIQSFWSNLDLAHFGKALCPGSPAGNGRSFPLFWR